MPVFSATAIQISRVKTPSMSNVTIDCFTGLILLTAMASKQIFEILNRHSCVPHNCRHGVCIDRVGAGHYDFQRTFRHENVFALPVNCKTSLLESFRCEKMIHTGELGHG